jgi:hypothetical protein
MDFPSYHEYRFEPDPLLSYIPLSTRLGALSNVTNCHQVLVGKTVFIALNNYPSVVDAKRNKWVGAR